MLHSAPVIFQTLDPEGEICVLDDGQRRMLAFGPGDEQSVCLKANPALLQLEYTQAMLLGLLFAPPRKVLCLGLGAGSLVTSLQRHCKGIRITVVELRQSVIDAAYAYFYLPRSRRIQMHCQDAATFLPTHREQYNLIFCDLYTAEGSSPLQSDQIFLQHCAARLQNNGLLVVNCWKSEQMMAQVERLSELFAEVRFCPAGPGNWVLLAANCRLHVSSASLKESAWEWSQKLGFPLTRHLQRLGP